MSNRNWCDTCRGDGTPDDILLRCATCPKRFHMECAGLRALPDDSDWICPHCDAAADNDEDASSSKNKKKEKNVLKKRIAAVRKCHTELKTSSRHFLKEELQEQLRPFAAEKWLSSNQSSNETTTGVVGEKKKSCLSIGPAPSYINATLRPYQVTGVNFLLSRYQLGTGCIVADEMGLGKTIQSLGFLASLKNAGLPGPHLVVTPLAVLQNWANEMKKFTPGLTFCKIHGSLQERDRLLSKEDVVGGEFDVYLTTYDTFLSEEAFFTESFLFHTVIIDEGHRLKNMNCKLCKGLARLNSPFRVLLTGTPLQNCLAELLALLQYVLPSVPLREDFFLSQGDPENKRLNRGLISQARDLLEQCMIRRIKSEVEGSLLPKIEYVIKPPLTQLQRKWYRSFLETDYESGAAAIMLTKHQLMMKVLQCGKVASHPKSIVLTADRERKKNADMAKRAQGSMFVKVHDKGPTTPEAVAAETELRNLVGEKLVSSCGKLAVLDRLMHQKKKAGSRVLVFSQYTLTLDVIEEYVKFRFGAMGAAYLRLDGTTNRIQREMDMRSFNKPGSGIFCYLISTRAGGQGINLATADTVVLYDTCWNPQVDLQAQDRAHRIGQKKQVIIYRLISSNTVEERILARARQKMVLDALVIKKRVGDDGLAGALADDDGDEDADMGKLNVEELWNVLSEGAAKVFSPAEDGRADFTALDYDKLITEAEPARWDDKTENEDSGDSKPSAEESELDGTIFAKRKVGRPKKVETVDLTLSDDDRSIPSADETSCSDASRRGSYFDPPTGKRQRKAPTNFVANFFDTNNGRKKPKIYHDSNCFCCRKPVGKLSREVTAKLPERSCNKKKPTPVHPNAPLECIACPRVYHMQCSGERQRPKTKAWYCPWHKCVTCDRKSSQAGGTLFHCMTCPLTYCFDCAPDEHTEGGQSTSPAALALTNKLEMRGVSSLKSYMFFTCSDCKTPREQCF